jgi:hypothetical protein
MALKASSLNPVIFWQVEPEGHVISACASLVCGRETTKTKIEIAKKQKIAIK